MKAASISSYAKTNKSEAFAEAFCAMRMQPLQYKNINVRRFQEAIESCPWESRPV
jgi:hypothetical protein